MSYTEYIDMYKLAQQKDCPYRAFVLDIVNSRKQSQYIVENYKYHQFVDRVYSLIEREELLTGREILLKDSNNIHKELGDTKGINGNLYNPMVLGDMSAYFVKNGGLSTERFIEIAVFAMKEYGITYPFHLATGVYETNEYAMGGNLLYKGYMPQILEKVSKNNGIIISQDTISNQTAEIEM